MNSSIDSFVSEVVALYSVIFFLGNEGRKAKAWRNLVYHPLSDHSIYKYTNTNKL